MNDEKRGGVGTTIILFIVAFFAFVTFLVYSLPLGNPFPAPFVNVLPYPAVHVNSGFLLYGSVLDRKDALLHFYEAEEMTVPTDDKLHQNILDTLIRRKLVHQLVKKNNLVISDADVDAFMEMVEDQSGSLEKFKNELERQYGWSLKEFKKQVAVPFVETQSLETFVYEDRTIQTVKKSEIQTARNRLDEGETFDAMVLEYSEDASKVVNGDFGWFEEAELSEVWRSPATHMDVGQISPVLEEKTRFVLLRLDKVDETGDEPRYNVSALIINKIGMDQVIEEFREESEVKIYIRL